MHYLWLWLAIVGGAALGELINWINNLKGA